MTREQALPLTLLIGARAFQICFMCQKHEGSSMLNKEQAAAAAEALLAVATSGRGEKNEARLRGISRAFRSQYLSQLAGPRQPGRVGTLYVPTRIA